MTRRGFLASTLCLPAVRAAAPAPPNIVFILADDLGYGDLSCLNPDSKIHTPNLDRLAAQGMLFTDAHSPSAVCTPTRYGVLTGRYSWRGSLESGVLQGGSPPLIESGRLTVPALLKTRGYATACIGKWHLGLGWASAGGQPVGDLLEHADFSRPFSGGPTTLGFDYFYGISASLDMPPYTFLENDRVEALPTARSEGKPFPVNWRPGPSAPGFRHQQVLRRLTEKAVEWLDARGANKSQPFFLYFPLTAPHTPVVPRDEFKGRTGAGDYGAFVAEVDWSVKQVLDALDRIGAAANTLLFFTSDNGPERQMVERKAEFHHFSAGIYRGHKRDLWDGGHHEPFLVRWPVRIKPGSRTNSLACLTDLMATAAAVSGASFPNDAGEDSFSLLPILTGGKASSPLRDSVIHHSASGLFSIRQGDWKLLLSRTGDGPDPPNAQGPPGQLYNMKSDAAETANLYDQHPEIVRRLTALLQRCRTEGRSAPRRS